MSDQKNVVAASGSLESAAVGLTQLVMQAEPDGPKGQGWDRTMVFRTYRRCLHIISNPPRQSQDDDED